MPKTSAMTEWSMTSSAGASGLIWAGSPPRSRTASRMVARSTTQGTPVKSCMITRAGVNWISCVRLGRRVPAAERPDVVGGDVRAVLGAQQVLQQHLEAVRQSPRAVDGGQPVDLVRRVADLQRPLAPEAVDAHRRLPSPMCRHPAPADPRRPVSRAQLSRCQDTSLPSPHEGALLCALPHMSTLHGRRRNPSAPGSGGRMGPDRHCVGGMKGGFVRQCAQKGTFMQKGGGGRT